MKIKARPTVYNGIKMRSRLEAGFAAWLDSQHFAWEYEPCAFGSQNGQYLPDFRLSNVFASWLPEPATVYIEVKPEGYETAEVILTKPREGELSPAGLNTLAICGAARIIAQSEPNALFVLARQKSPLMWIRDYTTPEGLAGQHGEALLLIGRPNGTLGFATTPPHECSPWEREYWKLDGRQPAPTTPQQQPAAAPPPTPKRELPFCDIRHIQEAREFFGWRPSVPELQDHIEGVKPLEPRDPADAGLLEEMRILWQDLVGEELAEHTEPDMFENGTLVIAARNTAWRTQVRLLGTRLKAKLNEDLDGTVREIKVRSKTAGSRRQMTGGRP